MAIKFLQTTAAAAAIGLASLNTQAASIWLEPVTQDIGLGSVASLELWADAFDVGGILAGGLDLFYDDTIVSYNGDFGFDDAFPTDPAFSRTGDDCSTNPALPGCSGTSEINGIAFGNFNGIAADGPILVGTLSFTEISLGVTPVTMADNDLPAGAWYATDGSGPLIIDYGSASFNIPDIPDIPLPAAAWLMISGLGVLLGFTRTRKAA